MGTSIHAHIHSDSIKTEGTFILLLECSIGEYCFSILLGSEIYDFQYNENPSQVSKCSKALIAINWRGSDFHTVILTVDNALENHSPYTERTTNVFTLHNYN